MKRVQISSSQGGGSTNPGSSTNPAHLFGGSSKLAGTPAGKRENQSTMDINKILMKKGTEVTSQNNNSIKRLVSKIKEEEAGEETLSMKFAS